jgi:hypothetical protein
LLFCEHVTCASQKSHCKAVASTLNKKQLAEEIKRMHDNLTTKECMEHQGIFLISYDYEAAFSTIAVAT